MMIQIEDLTLIQVICIIHYYRISFISTMIFYGYQYGILCVMSLPVSPISVKHCRENPIFLISILVNYKFVLNDIYKSMIMQNEKNTKS